MTATFHRSIIYKKPSCR